MRFENHRYLRAGKNAKLKAGTKLKDHFSNTTVIVIRNTTKPHNTSLIRQHLKQLNIALSKCNN